MPFKFSSSILFGTKILPDVLWRKLQLSLHLSKLTINENNEVYLDSRVGVARHGSFLRNIHFIAGYPLKFKNAIEANLNIFYTMSFH